MHDTALSYENFTEERQREVLEQLKNKDAMDIIKWAYDTFADDLIYACSFGAEGIVLIDLISKIEPRAQILFLDTHLHFYETYKVISAVKERYPLLHIQMIEPELSLAEQAEMHGDQLWRKNPDLCCRLRKVEPLKRALYGRKAWMSGLRREQSETRARIQYVNKDDKFHSIKICPLIHWTWEDIWNYIRTFQLPYNELHDRSYPSIGCEPCTQPAAGDSRTGRWMGHGKTECGLHS